MSTKLKALKALASLLSSVPPYGHAELLPSWIFYFKRLVLDNNRSVRLGALQVLQVITSSAGRHLAPHLKELIGSWWLAASDPYGEAAASASRSFEVRSSLHKSAAPRT